MIEPRHRRMFMPLLAVVVLFAAWSVYWWIARGYTKNEVMQRRAELADQGFTLACEGESWGGYPFRFEFSCQQPKFTATGHGTLNARSLLAVAQAYDPTHVVVLVDGPTHVEGRGLPPLTLHHDRAVASIKPAGQDDIVLEADIPNVSTDSYGKARDVQFFARPGSRAYTHDVAVRVKGLDLQVPGLETNGPVPIDSAQVIATLDRQAHAEIQDISAARGDLRVWAKGETGLDAENRPEGHLDVATNNISGLMSYMQDHLPLTEQQQGAMKLMTGLLGAKAETKLIAQDGVLSIGPFRVARLKSVY